MNPSPLLVVPAVLWTVVAGVAVIASIVLARRREPASAGWNPFGTDFPVVAAAAITGYTVATAVRGQFSLPEAAFALLWPAMAGSALAYVAGRRTRVWPRWAGPVFAAAGAALYGALPT